MRWPDEQLLDEFRFAPSCEACGRRVMPLDPHHCYRTRGQGGTRIDLRINLIALCRLCHTQAGIDSAFNRTLQAKIAQREGTTTERIVDYLNLVLRTDKSQPLPIWNGKPKQAVDFRQQPV